MKRSVRYDEHALFLCGDCVSKYEEEGAIVEDDWCSDLCPKMLTRKNPTSVCMRCKKIPKTAYSVLVTTKEVFDEEDASAEEKAK